MITKGLTAAEAPKTVSAATAFNRRRELAQRISGELEISLYWDAVDNSTSIEIWHPALHESLLCFAVPGENALDAFYHPFAHLQTSAAA
jgi:hypothetical protein